jgi:hypothetical protein
MNFYTRRFNVYLLPLLLLTALMSPGCALFHKKTPKEVGAVRVHIESPAAAGDETQTVSLLRADPVAVLILKDPVLTEADLLRAVLRESPGGFYVELLFDQTGALTLEQYTGAYGGKHFVVFGQWGEKLKDGRWLAAPIISGRTTTGTLAFTPDMSRAEAEQWVKGLNATAKKLQTGK